MRAIPRRLVLTLALALALPSALPMLGPAATMQQAVQSKRPIELQDIINWKSIGTTAVSNDGQWFAYRIAPGEGDAQIVVKRTRTGEKELTFDAGEIPTAGAAGGGGRGGDAGGAGSAALDFSEDSKFVAFTTYPSRREAQRLRRLRRPVQSSVTIVNLATGEKREYPRIRRFAFSGDAARWIALQRQPAQAAGCGRCGRGPAGGGRRCAGAGGGAGAATDAARHGPDPPRPHDRQELNIGNVAEFAFDKTGTYLALVIDARRQGRQRRPAPRHGDGRDHAARHRQGVLRAPGVDREGRRALRAQGHRRQAVHATRLYAVIGFTGLRRGGAPQTRGLRPGAGQDVPGGHVDQPQPRADVDRGPAAR